MIESTVTIKILLLTEESSPPVWKKKPHSHSDEHFKRKTFPQPPTGHCCQGGLSAAGVKRMKSEIKNIFYCS